MPNYAVDSARMTLMATGVVEEVTDWVEGPDGRRRPSETQSRNRDTGMPLWKVEVAYQQATWGRITTVTTKVTVQAETEPQVSPFMPVAFAGLTVEVRVDRGSNALRETWSAETMTAPGNGGAAAAPPEPTGTTRPGSDKPGGSTAASKQAA